MGVVDTPYTKSYPLKNIDKPHGEGYKYDEDNKKFPDNISNL